MHCGEAHVKSVSPQRHRGHRERWFSRVRYIESPSPPRFFAGEKVPKADEGAALGRSSREKRPSPALRVSLSPQKDAGRGTLDRKDAFGCGYAALCLCDEDLSYENSNLFQFAQLVANLRRFLEVEVLRRVLHLFRQTCDCLVEILPFRQIEARSR